jgi:DNA-binding PucR family transcriptional regulator
VTGTDPPRLQRAWIARLSPRHETTIDQSACPRTFVEDAVVRVGAGPVGWAIALSDMVVRRILDEVPALGGSPFAVEMLREGNEVTTLRALLTLAGDAAAALPASEVTLHGVRELVHRGVPLEAVLRGVRVGHASTTEAFLRACAESVGPDLAVDEITSVSRELFAYVNDLSDAMVRTYLEEHEVWTTSAAAARADIVRSLLSDPAAMDVGAASQTLGYDLRRTHEAVVVWSDSPGRGSKLQAAAVEALRSRGATTTLVVPVASGRLWAWGTVALDNPARTHSWESIAETLARHRMQAAFGTPAAGAAGFRRSHVEAERAERVERLRREAGRVSRHATAYADVAVISLLAADLGAAGDFVQRELGGLSARSTAMQALRTTLYHYLGAERSLGDVARRLHVAKGTVTYRVKRAQQVLGYDLGNRSFALHAALTLAEDLGDAVLLPLAPNGRPPGVGPGAHRSGGTSS